MKYEGIEGKVTGKYKGWIELDSANMSYDSKHNTNKVVRGITVTRKQDSITPILYGKILSSVERKVNIHFIEKETSPPYWSLDMEGVLMSIFNISGNGADSPTEEFTLTYTKISQSYTPRAGCKTSDSTKDKVWWDSIVN